ncbi:LPS-assembly protein LptD precursor [Sulfitobacter sp. THAF37]|uniref:LPS-assembly protein LptD n=1 Tax=Sulfitobacter sp. THAF37 TaxID=2587855 RepID=UPI0012A783B0|nr:LPS-assembly protein LptD precursor [Sulfitobacter sp. THAF37]
MRRWLLILALSMMPLTSAKAQQSTDPAAVLVADRVFLTRDRTLVAQGNVEAFQGETRLRANAIRYDQASGALSIEGPIVITEGADTLILADAAELDPDLQNGLLRGARLVLNQQLQLAANQINQVDGRYSQLYKTAVTSCKVCEDGRAPLWQIRARRVVHDKLEQQLYFDEASFHIRNIPVFYLPRLRLPDPTLERATGFLRPSLRTTSRLGTGVKIPYFIKIGDHRDLTLTPYLSSATRTLEFRYRQAFRNGRIQFDGAYTRDDERPGKTRGYLFGYGQFDLARDYVLDFAIEATSDRAYLTEYGYSPKDRLTSQLTVSRVRRDAYVRASIYNFESLRDTEVNDELPTIVLDGDYERRFFPRAVGGELRMRIQPHSHLRTSDQDIVGRDVARLQGDIKWLRRLTFGNGLVVDGQTGISFSGFDIVQDSTYSQNHSEVVPFAALALRYPMLRRETGSVTQMLEPIAQIAWVGGQRLPIPNDESTRVEFDEGNLLSLSRFPRPDRRERDAIAAIGVNWSRFDPAGWDAHLTIGQVLREQADPDFASTSGLSGTSSDFLLAGQIKTAEGLSLTGRGLFDENFDFAKAELRGDWDFARGRLGGSYVWLDADLAEDRLQAVSEIALDGDYRISRHWTASADWRFDVADERAASAGIGLTYDNECVSVDLSVNRRYSTSTSVEPSTNIGFNIGLRGFAATNGTERYVRSCRN